MAAITQPAFDARAMARGLLKPECLYRVYLAPGGLFFIHIDGPRNDVVAWQFGLIGLLINSMGRKKRERQVEAKKADLDQRSLRDRLEDHRDNFSVKFDDFLSARIITRAFLSGGKHAGRWKVVLKDRGKITFEFDKVDDMKFAIAELAKPLGDRLAVEVDWNEKKRKYVKKRP